MWTQSLEILNPYEAMEIVNKGSCKNVIDIVCVTVSLLVMVAIFVLFWVAFFK